MTKNLQQQLQYLGLGKNKSLVYLALLDMGAVKAGQIIEHTGIHRNLVYAALDELVKQKLAAQFIRRGVAVYEANSPDALLEKKKNEWEAAELLVKELKKHQAKKPHEIKVYEGVEGVIEARKASLNLKKGDTGYVFGGSPLIYSDHISELWSNFSKRRVSKGIKLKMLCDNTVPQTYIDRKNEQSLSQAKRLPLDVEVPAIFEMYGDILNIAVPGKQPVVFSLQSSEAAKGLKNYFEYFWNQEVTVETGIDALRRCTYGMLEELQPSESYEVLGAAAGEHYQQIHNLYDEFHSDRIKKGVIVRMLVYKESYERIKRRFTECGDPTGTISKLKKFVSAPKIPMQVNTFHNKTRIIIYDSAPVVVYLNRPEICIGFQGYFEGLWNQGL